MLYLDPQQSRVYRYIKAHPDLNMNEIRWGANASKADMRISEINFKSKIVTGEPLIVTSYRDTFRWCHKRVNRKLKHTVKKNGDRLVITFK